MIERTIVIDELGDPDAPVGSRPWCVYVANQIRTTLYDAQQSGVRLRSLVEAFKEHQGFQELGFLSWEDFCQKRLQKQADELEVTITLRVETQRRAENPLSVNSNGQHNSFDNYQRMDGGTSANYLTARIARDRPDILDRMKAGEFRSARAAAIEAGIVDPDKTRRHQLPTDPAAAGRYLAQRVDREWFESMIDAYYKAIG